MLVENGEYWLNNKGDLSILDVSVQRIEDRWPGARIGVLTSAPAQLRSYVPGVEPIGYQRGGGWPRRRLRPSAIGQLGPERAGPASSWWDAATALPAKVSRRLRMARHSPGDQARHGGVASSSTDAGVALSRDGGELPNAVADASAVIAIGGGYLTDVDKFQTRRTLDLLAYATDHGIPTVMIGQGIGPLQDPELLRRAAQVFPRVDLIALREGRRGPELLRSLGVPDERVVITGDDAVELAYSTRRARLGTSIGVCLRVAEYSPVDAGARMAVGRALQKVATEYDACLIPLIVSEYAGEDRRSTLPLLAGQARAEKPLSRFASARSLTRKAGGCRIVVTGAYHVAVFSLSQGVPVVALSASQYYDDKFEGLAAMFGAGLQLVRLDGDDLDARLLRAMRQMWAAAPELRSTLLDGATRQINASRSAFERAASLIDAAHTARLEAGRKPPAA